MPIKESAARRIDNLIHLAQMNKDHVSTDASHTAAMIFVGEAITVALLDIADAIRKEYRTK